ncbi:MULTISPECIES: ParA family protein [Microbacterium]|nr:MULTISPECIES: AAA family ATPase [Microbacterium]
MRAIAVANQKDGVGKTTVTMQLGAALSRRTTRRSRSLEVAQV